jgi:Zn-dependent M28 family amino/carboxypeptidase
MSRLPLLVLLAACANAETSPDPDLDPAPPFRLAERVDVARMIGHLDALQAIAAQHGDQRAAFSLGYGSSVDYVVDVLQQSGLEPQELPVEYLEYVVAASSLQVVAPAEDAGPLNAMPMMFSGPGKVEAEVWPVDLQLPPGSEPNSSTSGCELSDFTGLPWGAVALIQRGTCPFSTKVENAHAAGASAVLIFNEGQPDRTEVVDGFLTQGVLSPIPAMGLSYADGVALVWMDGPVVRVEVDAELRGGTDHNVVVTIPGRDRSRVLLVGAHLDSVEAGPGINDNGTGIALLLDIAEQAAAGGWQPETDLRLAWWGAEEIGLVGSGQYFFDNEGNPSENVRGVEAYLNFDMLGSPNGARFVYDGDAPSTSGVAPPPGSAEIESLFRAHFESAGLPTRETAIFDRSDSFWAAVVGLPVGGLFSGADMLKTQDEADVFGGEVGAPHDPCYHQACDVVAGVDPDLYRDLAVGAAAVIQQMAERPAPAPSRGSARATPPNTVRLEDLTPPPGCHEDRVLRE